MASESSPALKWSSYERSVPEISIINDSSLKLQSSSFGTNTIPPFEPLTRQNFPICSSPPLKQQYHLNNAPQCLPAKCETSDIFDKRELDLFKTEFLSAALKQNLNQLDLFKTEFFCSVRREHKNEIEELKNQIDLIKEQFKNILPYIKSELQAVLNDNNKSLANHSQPIQKYEVGVQVSLEKQDLSVQTENFVLDDDRQDIELKDKVNAPYNVDKCHEGFELRLTNDYEKVKDNNRCMPHQSNTNEFEKEYSESDEDEHPYKRPNRNNRNALPPDADCAMETECYGVAQPGIRRGGYARVQELRMTNRKQNFPEQPDLPCNDVSMATNAVLAKYLPPEKLAECQTPRRQNPPPAQDVVFNMTNVSFAMRYQAENELSPEVGNFMCPPQNRHLKPSRFNDQPEFWDSRHPRRVLEEVDWQGKQIAGNRGGQWRRPALDREWQHGNARDGLPERQYQEEFIYGRHEGAVRENLWGRCGPYPDNFVGARREDPNMREMKKNYALRGQPPMANRILDITAIKNQPKLT